MAASRTRRPSIVPLAALAFGVLFIAALVAAHTIRDVADAFFGMFADELLLLVLMTPVARVGREAVRRVVGRTGDIVITIEPEVPIMREFGGCPRGGRVALRTTCRDILVQTARRLGMAGGALRCETAPQHAVIKARSVARGKRGFDVIGMASGALGFLQLGMESGHL